MSSSMSVAEADFCPAPLMPAGLSFFRLVCAAAHVPMSVVMSVIAPFLPPPRPLSIFSG